MNIMFKIMEFISNKSKFKFIPKKVVSFDQITKNELIFSNDIHEKYNATTLISGQLIVCTDITKIKQNGKKIIKESYDEYLEFINNYNFINEKWIYNIIDGIYEQDKILLRNDQFVIIPNYTWDSYYIDKLQVLTIVTDKSIRSIRDLDYSHVQLLKLMYSMTITTIKKTYNVDESELKSFLHYEPSTYLLHIHFVHINNIDFRSSIEYSHDINSVIFNLTLDSDYYKKISLNKFV